MALPPARRRTAFYCRGGCPHRDERPRLETTKAPMRRPRRRDRSRAVSPARRVGLHGHRDVRHDVGVERDRDRVSRRRASADRRACGSAPSRSRCPAPSAPRRCRRWSTEPNRRPSTPAFCVILTAHALELLAERLRRRELVARGRSRARRASLRAASGSPASRASPCPCGIRKLRAKPFLTLTTSPRLPTFAIFSSRMICMAALPSDGR